MDGKEAPQQLVHVPGFFDFIRGTEGDGLPGGSGACRAADAVHIDFRFFRQIVVDDELHVFHVNAAGGDVRGDENGRFPGTEFPEHAFTRALALVAVDGGGRVVLSGQEGGQAVRAVLGPGEDERAARLFLLFQQIQGKGPFFRLGANHAEGLFHPVRRGGRGGDHHRFRFLKQGLGQLQNVVRHGGGEHLGMAFLRDFGDDLFQGRSEAHVQHVVRFVQNQGFHTAQVDGLAFQMVNQPAGRGYQNIQAAGQLLELGGVPHAAEDDGGGQVQPFGIGADVVMNLRGQFPGGAQDERPYLAGKRLSGMF